VGRLSGVQSTDVDLVVLLDLPWCSGYPVSRVDP
jgi:hypothetical protein